MKFAFGLEVEMPRFDSISSLGYFSLLMLAGCGPALGEPVNVTGTLTLDGKPLEKVTVAFNAKDGILPADKRYGSGVSDAQGNFSIPKLYPGEYAVTLSEPAPSNIDMERPDLTKRDPKLAPYQTDSPFTAKVSKDSTNFKFDADSKLHLRKK